MNMTLQFTATFKQLPTVTTVMRSSVAVYMTDNERRTAQKVLCMKNVVKVSFLLRFSVAGSRLACKYVNLCKLDDA